MPESSSEEAKKSSPDGPGLAVYLGVGAVLMVTMGVLQFKLVTVQIAYLGVRYAAVASQNSL